MREAIIILPKFDNTGMQTVTAHDVLRSALLSDFGGFTRCDCVGSWRDPETGAVFDDDSYMYCVAMEPGPKNDVKLFAAAIFAAECARQEAIYVRDANGGVHILRPTKNEAKLAA